MSSKKLLWPLMCILVIFSMIAAGCAPAATPAPATEAPVAATEAPAAPPPAFAVPPAGQELQDAMTGKFKGTTVTVDGPFATADAVKFEDSVKEFEDATGIDIQYYRLARNSKPPSASVSTAATRPISSTSRSLVCWQPWSRRAKLST